MPIMTTKSVRVRNNKTGFNKFGTLLLFVLLVTLGLSGCKQPVNPTEDLSKEKGVITFFSDRKLVELETEYVGPAVGYVFIMDEDGNNLAYLDGMNSVLRDPIAWSPNGHSFALVAYVEGIQSFCLIIFDHNGSNCLVKDGNAPAWSPNGQWLSYYQRDYDGNTAGLYVIDINSRGTEKLLTLDLTTTNVYTSWSPDSSSLVYSAPGETDKEVIWVFDLKSATSYILTDGEFPSWSPVSSRISFVRNGDIWIYEVDTGIEYLLLSDPAGASWLAWSPDGQYLLFTTQRDGNNEIYRVRQDGSKVTNLTNSLADESRATWRFVEK